MAEHAVAETYSSMSADELARWLQLHRRRVLTAETELAAERARLLPLEAELARREARVTS